MTTLDPKTRSSLSSQAHHLKPVVQVGKNGLTPSLVEAVDRALDDHELIKVKYMDFKDDKRDIAEKICAEIKCEIVKIIGNIAILYRQHEDTDKRKIRV